MLKKIEPNKDILEIMKEIIKQNEKIIEFNQYIARGLCLYSPSNPYLAREEIEKMAK